jgi:ParB-like chromosome segregation protein Spo0J
MAEFGWTVPCLVGDDGDLIAGHGRVLAAAQLGLAEAPVIVLGHLTEAQRRAYRIADNKLTELGGWDEGLLLEELRGLMAAEFDLGLIGIPEDELDALLRDADDDSVPIDDDTADTIPEPPAEPITRPGDIWALGAHRLICGDATDADVVARLMEGAQSSLMFTSPPYAQQRDYGAARETVGDWDALMQGVFAAAPVTDAAQLLVNLGLVHRDGEWRALARVHLPLQPPTPQTAQDRPVQTRGRNFGRRWAARGQRHGPSQDRLWQRNPDPPHPRQRVSHHASQGWAGCRRIAPGRVSGGAGRGGVGSVQRPQRSDL